MVNGNWVAPFSLKYPDESVKVPVPVFFIIMLANGIPSLLSLTTRPESCEKVKTGIIRAKNKMILFIIKSVVFDD
jgi:hypothetical protein